MNLKPVSKTRKPKVAVEPIEAKLNSVHGIGYKPKAVEEDEPSRRRGLDPLTEQLGCTSYYSKMIWPTWFFEVVNGLEYKLSVSRYYQEKKLALDMGKVDETKLALKQKLLADHGIQYFFLTDAESISDMLSQVEVQ